MPNTALMATTISEQAIVSSKAERASDAERVVQSPCRPMPCAFQTSAAIGSRISALAYVPASKPKPSGAMRAPPGLARGTGGELSVASAAATVDQVLWICLTMPLFGSKNLGSTTGQPPFTTSRIVNSCLGTGKVFAHFLKTLCTIGR